MQHACGFDLETMTHILAEVAGASVEPASDASFARALFCELLFALPGWLAIVVLVVALT